MSSATVIRPSAQNSPKPRARVAPRIWEGCNLLPGCVYMARTICGSSKYWHIAIIITCVRTFHSILRLHSATPLRSCIAHTAISEAPYSLSVLANGAHLAFTSPDPRRAPHYPTTYECFRSQSLFADRELSFNVDAFLLRRVDPWTTCRQAGTGPQEDEFALCMLGLPHPI